MPGIIRSLRELFRQARTFGHAELAQIRAAAVDLKSEVDLIRAAREKSQQQMEQLALSKLRQTLQAYQAEGETIQLQKAAVEAAFEELSEDVKQQHAAQRQQKITDQMAKVLEAVDLDKYMEGAPLEEAVRPGHDLPEKVLRALKDDERP